MIKMPCDSDCARALATIALSALAGTCVEPLVNRTVRSPLVPLDEQEYADLRAGLAAAGLL